MTNWQEEQLLAMAAGVSVDEEHIDFTPDELPASPVAAVFEKAEFVKAGGDVAWFENAVTTDADIAKTLIANRMGCGAFGSAAAMPIARTDSELHKRATEIVDDPTRDLSKAASRGKVRYEHTQIPGENGPETWVLGWNDRGENIYSAPLEDHKQMHRYEPESLET